jgi:hypothetical protein
MYIIRLEIPKSSTSMSSILILMVFMLKMKKKIINIQ